MDSSPSRSIPSIHTHNALPSHLSRTFLPLPHALSPTHAHVKGVCPSVIILLTARTNSTAKAYSANHNTSGTLASSIDVGRSGFKPRSMVFARAPEVSVTTTTVSVTDDETKIGFAN